MTAPQVSPDVLTKANALLGALVAGLTVTAVVSDGGVDQPEIAINISSDAGVDLSSGDHGIEMSAAEAERVGTALLAFAAYLRTKEAGQ